MKRIDVMVRECAPEPGAILLFPKPFQHWDQVFHGLDVENAEEANEITALNSDQEAVEARPDNGSEIAIGYEVTLEPRSVAPNVWEAEANRYTTADADLAALAREITADANTETAKLRALIEYGAQMFGYGHPDGHFYDGMDSVPAVCGTTKGNCVDINTFLLAAARSLGITGQYIAGYWFHPDKTETRDMHCWLAFKADGQVLFWDLAHHLKWGIETLAPGLNPGGGRRAAMSRGRGLKFETVNGLVEISHFSEPVWVMPDGTTRRPDLRIKVTD